MLAVVKTPHIELSINGDNIDDLIKWIGKKFDLTILDNPDDDELINIEDSDFWKEMAKNKTGNILAGYRLKAGLTQKQLAQKINISQNMISDFENGKRNVTNEMLKKFKDVLNIEVSL